MYRYCKINIDASCVILNDIFGENDIRKDLVQYDNTLDYGNTLDLELYHHFQALIIENVQMSSNTFKQ